MEEGESQGRLEKVEPRGKRPVGVTGEAWVGEGSVEPVAVGAEGSSGSKRHCGERGSRGLAPGVLSSPTALTLRHPGVI